MSTELVRYSAKWYVPACLAPAISSCSRHVDCDEGTTYETVHIVSEQYKEQTCISKTPRSETKKNMSEMSTMSKSEAKDLERNTGAAKKTRQPSQFIQASRVSCKMRFPTLDAGSDNCRTSRGEPVSKWELLRTRSRMPGSM